jgi:hypothetical protein
LLTLISLRETHATIDVEIEIATEAVTVGDPALLTEDPVVMAT